MTPERIWAYDDSFYVETNPYNKFAIEYIRSDRIEELEAKLAKAMDALDWIGNHMVMSMALNEGGLITSMKQHARNTLAAVSETHKLKGEN